MAGRRLRKQVSPREGLARRREDRLRAAERPRLGGLGPRAPALLQGELLGLCFSPTGLPVLHSGWLALPLQVSGLRGATPGPGARTAPESLGHDWMGSGQLPGGWGCSREDSHWGTCNRVSPVGQLTGYSGVRACDPGGDPAALGGPTAEALPEEPSPVGGQEGAGTLPLVIAVHCSWHPWLGRALGPCPQGRAAPPSPGPATAAGPALRPPRSHACRSPGPLLQFGRKAHSGGAGKCPWLWCLGVLGRLVLGPRGVEWGGQEGPDAGESPSLGQPPPSPPPAGSLGQRTGL